MPIRAAALMYPALWLAFGFWFGCENLRFSHNQVNSPIECGFWVNTVLAVRRVLCPWRTDTAASNLRRAAASDSTYNEILQSGDGGFRPPGNSRLCLRLSAAKELTALCDRRHCGGIAFDKGICYNRDKNHGIRHDVRKGDIYGVFISFDG